MGDYRSTRLPLHDVSNGYISQDHAININQKRRKLASNTTTNINTMASIIETVNTSSKVQIDDLIQLKQDKQNDLYNLNGEIWKIQTQIPDLELTIEKLNSKLQIVKSNFQSLENKIDNLNIVKNHKIKSLNDSISIFKSTIDKSFDEKVVNLSQTYDDKITNIINSKHSQFKSQEKIIFDKITVLKNSLEDYSEKHLTEAKVNLRKDLESEIKDLKVKHSDRIDTINEEINTLNTKIQSFTEKIHQLDIQSVAISEIINGTLKSTLNTLNERLVNIQSEESTLKSQLKTLNNSKGEECNKLLNLKEECRQYNHEIEQFNQQIKDEETYRRFLHNKLQEMKGNIRVFCRIKPESENIFKHKIQPMSCTNGLKESLVISEPASQPSSMSSSPIKKSVKSYTFSFDKIFDENSSNGDIFEEISQLVQSSLDGFNVCIFTYGQTGSGKTFTMSNPNDGMIPRSIAQMFEKIDMLSSSLDKDYQLYGQFFEIYGDNVRDLIDGYDNNELDDEELIRPDSEINDIKMIKLTSIDQIQQLLDHTTKKRATASTMANDVSSRSHSIFKVHIASLNKDIAKYNVIGSLNLVDLAGSERLAHSQVTGIRLKETLAINKSLSSLGDVIASLKSKSSHVPYRNSKLTYILKDSLGGDSKTLMFVNICCLNSHFNESLSSLRFASKVNNTALK